MRPDISFIFVNFRSVGPLQKALLSVYQSVTRQGILAEYIIVNNDPDERLSIDRLSTHSTSPRIIHRASNDGFGRANNAGARSANGEVLFFVNPDTQVVRANLLGLLAAFRFRPKALYGMALIQWTGEREPWSAGLFPNLGRVILSWIAPELLPHPWRAHCVQPTEWVSGAALALRREFFQLLGGFDETFFLYFEDVDLAHRAIKAGGFVGVYPFIEFRHTGGQSHSSLREKKLAYYAGQRQYFRKWRPNYELTILSLGQRIRSRFSAL